MTKKRKSIVINKNVAIKKTFKNYVFGGICKGENIVCSYASMTKEQLFYIVSNYPNLRNHFVFKQRKRYVKKK